MKMLTSETLTLALLTNFLIVLQETLPNSARRVLRNHKLSRQDIFQLVAYSQSEGRTRSKHHWGTMPRMESYTNVQKVIMETGEAWRMTTARVFVKQAGIVL
jgi:5-methylcytosine-specific restriction endonuclease McrBC regulatory subunit McrC